MTHAFVFTFEPNPTRRESRVGPFSVNEWPLLQISSSSDLNVTATNRMQSSYPEAFGKKCCYYWSLLEDLTRFDIF